MVIPLIFFKCIFLIVTANLGEHRIREINDEINKLQRQKHYWEVRIKELGNCFFYTIL